MTQSQTKLNEGYRALLVGHKSNVDEILVKIRSTLDIFFVRFVPIKIMTFVVDEDGVYSNRVFHWKIGKNLNLRKVIGGTY